MAPCPFNLYTDSHYIAEALQVLKTVAYINPTNNQVQELFAQVQRISWSNGIQQLKIWLPEGEQLSNPPKPPQSVPPCEKENEVNLYRVVWKRCAVTTPMRYNVLESGKYIVDWSGGKDGHRGGAWF